VPGDVAAQTERVMRNLAGVLRAAGTDWRHVVKTTVYLHDMAHFPLMNEVYARHLGESRPARSTVQAAGLPRGVLVEIDCIARIP
jgi:2-iminobutanoate/2-iminopropanoate deaminase